MVSADYKKEIWEGSSFGSVSPKILILGESHYVDGDENDSKLGKPIEPGETRRVIEYFLKIKNSDTTISKADGKSIRWTAFFTKIAHSFGYMEENTYRDFYNKIIFKNYLDVYSGTRINYTKKQLSKQEIVEACNNALFQLINEKEIDVLICFSSAVYWSLPSQKPQEVSAEEELLGKRLIARSYKYQKELKLEKCKETLKKDLLVYAFPHPSFGGFSPVCVKEYLNRKGLRDI